MSRAARRLRRRQDRDRLREASFVGAALRGCICNPELRHRPGGFTIFHSDWCPAADTGSQLIFLRGRHQSAEEFARVVAAVLQALRNGGP